MKEIGEKLKEARESMGITVEEASQDLKFKISEIENIEEGNKEAFKDVFYLKEFIKNYSKYLGLDFDSMVEEFNEYLFDFTSKISIDDIKKAEKERTKKENNLKEVKISSPYTTDKGKEKKVPLFLTLTAALLLLVIIVYLIIIFVTNKNDEVTNIIAMEGEIINELA